MFELCKNKLNKIIQVLNQHIDPAKMIYQEVGSFDNENIEILDIEYKKTSPYFTP